MEPLAVWSLVAGVLLVGPVALVLAILALRRIARRGTRGRGLAIAGAVLGVLATLGIVAVVVVAILTGSRPGPLPADVGSLGTRTPSSW